LIIWPETVLRVYLRQGPVYQQRVRDLLRQLGTPLFIGALDLPSPGPGELNSGYLIAPADSSGTQIYHKLRLLPFGEYVPGAGWLPVLLRWRTTGRFVAAELSHLTLTLSQGESVDELGGRASRRPLETLRHGASRLLRRGLLSPNGVVVESKGESSARPEERASSGRVSKGAARTST
jgi:hypothetical protein